METNNTVLFNPTFKKRYDPFYDVVFFLNNIASSFKYTNQFIHKYIFNMLLDIDLDHHHRPTKYYNETSKEYTDVFNDMTSLIKKMVPLYMFKPTVSDAYDIVVK